MDNKTEGQTMAHRDAVLLDLNNQIDYLESRLESRPSERLENERLLAKARAERDRWLAENTLATDVADAPDVTGPPAPDADDPTTGDRDHE